MKKKKLICFHRLINILQSQFLSFDILFFYSGFSFKLTKKHRCKKLKIDKFNIIRFRNALISIKKSDISAVEIENHFSLGHEYVARINYGKITEN